MKKILIPVDSSEDAKRAVEEGIKMAKVFGSQVTLLYVANVKIGYSFYETNLLQESLVTLLEDEKKFAETMLEAYKETFGGLKDKVETVILEGNIGDEIIDYAKEAEFDLIIIGSRGTGSIFGKNHLGSVANKVLHYFEKPVLVVK